MARMLAVLRTETNDRIVIVSNYTQTLDLFSNLCRERQVCHMDLVRMLPGLFLECMGMPRLKLQNRCHTERALVDMHLHIYLQICVA